MKSAKSLSLLAVGLFLLCATGVPRSVLIAQAPNQQTPQTPPSVTFQLEVNYVDVDAIVTDGKGNFIEDLKIGDFEIFEDGKSQTIEMFSYVELPVEPPDRFLFLNRPVTSDVRSNRRTFDGRVYVIVLDDLDISPLRTLLVKKAAREFVERHFGANDMAAVVYTSGRTEATQDFTSDRGLLLAAIDKFVGRRLRSAAIETLERHYHRQLTKGLGDNDAELAPDPDAGIGNTSAPIDIRDLEREQRALAVLDTLRNLGEFLSSVRGRRKAVLLFSEGLEMPMNEIYGIHTATDVVGAIKDAITAAARSNVNFFALDPRGLIGMTSDYIELAGSGAPHVALGAFGSLNAQQGLLTEMRLSQDSLRTLAEETGGFAAVNTNVLSSAFDRIVDANSRYYVLGYYPPTHPRDGRFHRIDVRVTRPGLRVSARKGYASPRGRTPTERRRDEEAKRTREAKRVPANNISAELREVLDTPMQQSGLTLSVQAAAFKHTQKEASVALAIELDGERLQFASQGNPAVFANKIELSFFGVNEQGRAQRATRSELDLTLKPETYERVKAHGLRVNPRIALEPGRYQIRVAARDRVAGQIGSVFYDLHVPDFRKDPLMMSGLLLTAPSAGQVMTAQTDPATAKLLPGPATSRRSFLRSDMLTVFAEIYDNGVPRQPRQIETVVSMVAESGQEAFSARDSLANGPSTSLGTSRAASRDGAQGVAHWTAYGLTRDVPLRNVPPGRYLLKVEAKLHGNSNSVARETLITIQ